MRCSLSTIFPHLILIGLSIDDDNTDSQKKSKFVNEQIYNFLKDQSLLITESSKIISPACSF